MDSRSRKRSLSAGSEKMERVGDRYEKMEGHCSTGQSPQKAVAPTEEEERIINSTTRSHFVDYFYEIYIMMHGSINIKLTSLQRTQQADCFTQPDKPRLSIVVRFQTLQ
jgi:hypothetical protein